MERVTLRRDLERPAKISRKARKPFTPTLACFRSSISNGSDLLHDLDHRSAWARRLRDLIADHTSDLGGLDNVSEAERRLIRRASMLTLQMELMEQGWATNSEGEASPKSLETYQRCANTLRRLLESLGLDRRAKPVLSLGEVLRPSHREVRP
jgi:hypothetical protein